MYSVFTVGVDVGGAVIVEEVELDDVDDLEDLQSVSATLYAIMLVSDLRAFLRPKSNTQANTEPYR